MDSTPQKPSESEGAFLRKILLGLGLLGLFAVGFSVISGRMKKGPSWEERDSEMKALEGQMGVIAADIKALMGSGTCNSDDQCRVVGLGPKVCDGYLDFLVYSTVDAKEGNLLERVAAFNRLAQRVHETNLNVPHCGVQPKAMFCRQNRCQKLDEKK